MAPKLLISEIFRSIQGETSYAGLPCVFVRTAGCNLGCRWCDTEYARSADGSEMTPAQVCRQVEALGAGLVCITGGEPMLQAAGVCDLAAGLLAGRRTVLLETNGTLDLSPVPDGVVIVMDVKCPASGEAGGALPANLERLGPHDQVKFVIAERGDFEWAAARVREHGLGATGGPQVLFAPARGRLSARRLADWILESGLQVRLQIQLHKVLWPEKERGV